jgi:hypothetical protein
MPTFLLVLAAVTLLGHLATAVAVWRGTHYPLAELKANKV